MSHIQNYLEYILKKHGEKTVNPSIRIYVNKIENRISFKTKTGYYLEFLTPEIMKLLGSDKIKITKNVNDENDPNFEITVNWYLYIVTLSIIIIYKIQESCIHLF